MGELRGIRFAVLSPIRLVNDARIPGPIGAALVLSRHIGDACQQCPIERARELKRCSVCRAVYYCTRRDGEGGVPARGVGRAQEGVQEGDEGEEAARGGELILELAL